MAITLSDIAAHVGVSLPTVNQILNPTSKRADRFAKSTREKVERAAMELGYRPNISARSMATGRFGAVTLVLSNYANRSIMPPGLLFGINESLVEADLHLLLAGLPDQTLTNDEAVPKLLRQLASDGLLINYNAHIPTRMLELIDQHRIPSVWINSKQESNCVHPDDERAGYNLARLLIEAGHTRIAFVDYTYGPDPSDPHYSNTDRRLGFRRAMLEAGLGPRLICGEGNIPVAERIAFTRSWLSAPGRLTGVVCYTHFESAAILAATDRMGVAVSGDLAIVTVHDEPVRHFDIPVPTAVLPEREIGRRAVAMLLDRIAGSTEKANPIAVPLEMAHAESVAGPR